VKNFYNEIYRAYCTIRREPVHFFIGTFILAFFFLVYEAGMNALGGERSIYYSTFIYVNWIILSNGLFYVSGEIEKDIRHGVIERIFISGRHLSDIVVCRSILGMIHTLIVAALVYLVIWLLRGGEATFSPEDMGWLMTSMLAGVGLGLVAAGLTLLIRPVFIILVPVQMIMLALLSGVTLLANSTGDGGADTPLRPFADWSVFGIIGAVMVLILGYWLFRTLERRARLTGVAVR
jgi:hypothetical protein